MTPTEVSDTDTEYLTRLVSEIAGYADVASIVGAILQKNARAATAVRLVEAAAGEAGAIRYLATVMARLRDAPPKAMRGLHGVPTRSNSPSTHDGPAGSDHDPVRLNPGATNGRGFVTRVRE